MESQVSGCGQHVVTIFREGFHGFSYLEGTLELFHFEGVKVSLLLGLGNGSTIPEFKHTLIFPLGQSKAT